MIDTDTVKYKEVPECPGYKVGSDGTVWSCHGRKGKGIGNGRGVRGALTNKWKQLKPGTNKDGVRYVYIRSKHGPICRSVHNLVLTAFVGPRPDGMQCRHFPDRDRSNNRLENLQWGTQKENEADKLIHGTHIRGERGSNVKLNNNQVIAIRSSTKTSKQLASEYGISSGQVNQIRARRRWKHLKSTESEVRFQHVPKHGNDHEKAKITDDIVRAMRTEHKEKGTKFTEFARRYGLSAVAVRNAVIGKTWKHVI